MATVSPNSHNDFVYLIWPLLRVRIGPTSLGLFFGIDSCP
jgi:hypothetical protein